MDCQMPVMDGFEASRQIRENETRLKMNHVPIIAMTGNAFESDRTKCLDAGMDDFMSKPVEPDILAQKIRSNLKSQESPEKSNAKEKPSEIKVESTPVEVYRAGIDPVLCFDKNKLLTRFEGDKKLVELIVNSFLQEAPELIEKIHQAIDKNDANGVRLSSHALKGSAANVNADLLSRAALKMETQAKIENSDSFAATLKMIQTEYNNFTREAG